LGRTGLLFKGAFTATQSTVSRLGAMLAPRNAGSYPQGVGGGRSGVHQRQAITVAGVELGENGGLKPRPKESVD
jgi:hypothetical protein